MFCVTGVKLSKILSGQTKILGGKKVVKSDKCIGVSQLLGGTCPGCPQSLRLYFVYIIILGYIEGPTL